MMGDDDGEMQQEPPIDIDGSHLEGGGQILRNAISYAVLLQKSVTINNIRANRGARNPGVRPQHLAGMRLAVEVGGGGELEGAEIGAKTVSYICRGDESDTSHEQTSFLADPGTAGSIALLLQAALLPALAKSMRQPRTSPVVTIELRGGTNATGAPQIDYVTDVFAPFLNSYLQQDEEGTINQRSSEPPIGIEVIKRGYYPKGGGIVRVNMRPPPTEGLPCRELPRLGCRENGIRAAMELKQAYKSNPRFRKRFVSPGAAYGDSVKIEHVTDCLGSGSGIILIAHPLNTGTGDRSLPYPSMAASALGDRKVRPNETGINAAKELIDCITSGGCVDRWMQDQLIPLMALADGGMSGIEMSEMLVGELTLHTKTAMWVAEKMTGCKFEVEKLYDDVGEDAMNVNETANGYGENGCISGRHIIRCDGIGFYYS